jgi:putative ABC transport system substrate-binding protein
MIPAVDTPGRRRIPLYVGLVAWLTGSRRGEWRNMKIKCAALTIAVVLAVGFHATPLTAQMPPQGRVYRLGMLSGGKAPPGPVSLISEWPDTAAALRALGYEEGRNFVLEARFADAKLDRLPALAAQLVQLRVDLIFARGTPATRAAKAATATIPILFNIGVDPVEKGLVASYARPGGNLTGFANPDDLDAKRLEYLKRAVPGAVRIAVLKTSGDAFEGVRDAARVLGVQVQWLEVRGPSDLAGAFAAAGSGRANALLVADNQWVVSHLPQIAKLAAQHKLPAIAHLSDFVKAGGLLFFGGTEIEMTRQRAEYVDRILKGAKPADLPVIKPTTFEFTVNLKAAKALGLTIPQSLLAQATEVIQ